MTIILTYQPLPPNVPALVHANPDDTYTIIVNQNLSEESRKEAIRHEVKHITGGDLFKEGSVNTIETSCHGDTANFRISENLEFYVKDGD